MAVAVACAPVIYPWYLLYFTPFLLSAATLPLTVWTYSIVPVYLVWDWAQYGGAMARARLAHGDRIRDSSLAAGVVLWRSEEEPERHPGQSPDLAAKSDTSAATGAVLAISRAEL